MLQESLPSPKKTTTFSWIKLLADITTVLGVLVCLVLIIGYSVDLYRHGKQKIFIGWFSSAGFVLLTIPISLRIIVQHLTHWVAPNVQKYIVRIVWMVPIYAVESWIALRFKFMANYLEKIRECYEAYVIFCFMYYLIALLGGDEAQIAYKLRKQAADIGKQSWFSPLVGTKPTGSELLRRCKLGVFQYVIVKNLVAIVACILQSQGIQHEGDFSFNKPYIYQCFIANISQLWALYCLVVFYVATKDELSHWRPVGKFLCVKMVVFFTWWQSILIEIFFASPQGEVIANNTEDSWTVNEISKGLQDYLICIEMFFASVAFSLAFSYKDYDSYRAKKRFVHGDGSFATVDNADAEDVGLLSSHGEDFEVEHETKPFLSAFFQSSIPDDIVNDFRKLTKIGPMFWNRTQNDQQASRYVGSVDAYDDGDLLVGIPAPHRPTKQLSLGTSHHSDSDNDELDTLHHRHRQSVGSCDEESAGQYSHQSVEMAKLAAGSSAGKYGLPSTPAAAIADRSSSPRVPLPLKSMPHNVKHMSGSAQTPSGSFSGGSGFLSARKLPLQPDETVEGFTDEVAITLPDLPPSGNTASDTQDIEGHVADSALHPSPRSVSPSPASTQVETLPVKSTSWSFFSPISTTQ